MYDIGLHFTIARGFTYAARTVHALGADTFQFFSRNPRGSRAKVYDVKDIATFQQLRVKHGFAPLMAHAPYTMNLASGNESVWQFSRNMIGDDLIRMENLGIEFYNLHPGNPVGIEVEEGIARIVDILNDTIRPEAAITVLLETMSGRGREIGYRFEQLRRIIDGVTHSEKVGVCMDLCHMFSSGYDIVNRPEAVLEDFDRIVGLGRLKAVHLNDSANPFDSRRDVHAPIGQGAIGLEAVVAFLRQPVVCNLPCYLETPLGDEGHAAEIAMLKRKLSS